MTHDVGGDLVSPVFHSRFSQDNEKCSESLSLGVAFMRDNCRQEGRNVTEKFDYMRASFTRLNRFVYKGERLLPSRSRVSSRLPSLYLLLAGMSVCD